MGMYLLIVTVVSGSSVARTIKSVGQPSHESSLIVVLSWNEGNSFRSFRIFWIWNGPQMSSFRFGIRSSGPVAYNFRWSRTNFGDTHKNKNSIPVWNVSIFSWSGPVNFTTGNSLFTLQETGTSNWTGTVGNNWIWFLSVFVQCE